MIRHRPHGLGHPYRIDLDQRVPARPVAGSPIELRATTDAATTSLEAELEIEGERCRVPLAHFVPRDEATSAADGHLAAAANAGLARGRRAWRLVLDPQPAGARIRYRFRDGAGRQTRWHEFTVAAWSADGGTLRLDGPLDPGRLVPESVQWLRAEGGPFRLRFSLVLEPTAHVIGFGERFDRLDQRGERLDAVVFEQYRDQGKRTYIPVPFAMVVPEVGTGWGFHVRTGRRTWYDVGASRPDRLVVEVALDPDERAPIVEVASFVGTPREVLGAFLAQAGLPVQPPSWVFRPWMSANEWNTDARVRREVERTIAEGIPAGVLVIEAWSDEQTFVAFRDARYEVHADGAPHRLADFTFPADGAWPDPRGLVEWLHERGIRVLLWQVPLLKARPAPRGQALADRDTMVARGLAVRDGEGRPYRNRGWWFPQALMPDWTNPETADWWLAKRRYLLDEVGIDGFKTDGGEHAWGDELRYADGTLGDQANNAYPVAYAAAYHDLMRAAGRDPVTFSRAGFTGAGQYPLHWAGDERSTWDAFRASITAGLTAGASGVFFWGWDLGGFSGPIPSAELYLRAAAMAALCPVMQYHAEFNHHRDPSNDRTPWNIAARTGDPRVLPAFRRFARLREALVGYLEAEAARSVAGSVPLMRALCFDWPEDPEVWRHPQEYLLGDDLLVAPVTEAGATEWEVYLPTGEWTDAWRGTRHTGPATLRVPAPLEEIPAFRRSSAPGSLRDAFACVGGDAA
ncbi:MAG: glycoside hydrolase family 31 protein [Candidatus Limnocylindrales bacterium]